MKKYIYSLALCLCVSGSLYAGNGEKYVGISGGYSLLRAIDVRLSYEMESRYHGSHELFAEFYDRYEKGDWKYLQEYRGGYAYKFPLHRGKNSTFKMRMGAALGADAEGFTCGFQMGFELNRTFGNGVQGFIAQNNEYALWTRRPWRNGLSMGLRIPF